MWVVDRGCIKAGHGPRGAWRGAGREKEGGWVENESIKRMGVEKEWIRKVGVEKELIRKVGMEKECEASEGGSDLCARLYPCVAQPTCARSPPASAQAPERRVTMRRNAAMGQASA